MKPYSYDCECDDHTAQKMTTLKRSDEMKPNDKGRTEETNSKAFYTKILLQNVLSF